MIYIVLFTFTTILCITCSIKPNISHKNKCVSCEFFLSKRNIPFVLGIENESENGYCSLFKKEERKYKKNIDVEVDLDVDENNETNRANFYHCSTARAIKDMCGEEGRFYRQKKSSKKSRSKCVNKLRRLINYYLSDYEEENE